MKGLNLKERKGITLIALVITIIVLLILAGVTINTLFGNESVLEKASEAKEEDAHGKVRDQIQLELVNYELEKGTGETNKTAVQYLADKGYFNEAYSEETESYTIKTEKISNVSTGKGASKEAGDVYVVEKESEENNNWVLRYYKTSSDVKDLLTITSTGETEEEIIKDAKLEIGDYVEYNIPYKDVYSYHEFTKTTGWRVLDKGTDNGDGTFSNVKLISTGVPARLDGFYDETTLNNYRNDGATDGKWVGNETDVTSYMGEFDTGEYIQSSYANVKMAAGLYKNFERTTYDPGKEPQQDEQGHKIGKGSYKEINGKTEGQLTGREFMLEGKVNEVHNLTLKELNQARGKEDNSLEDVKDTDLADGLFWLNTNRGLGYYENAEDAYGGHGDEWFDYWLAFPHADYNRYVRMVSRGYDISTGDCYYYNYNVNTRGVRPVVTLISNVYKTNSGWKIK